VFGLSYTFLYFWPQKDVVFIASVCSGIIAAFVPLVLLVVYGLLDHDKLKVRITRFGKLMYDEFKELNEFLANAGRIRCLECKSTDDDIVDTGEVLYCKKSKLLYVVLRCNHCGEEFARPYFIVYPNMGFSTGFFNPML